MIQVIQKLTVVTSLCVKTFDVGDKHNGQTIIEITPNGSEFENSIHSEYLVRGEDHILIAVIENCPVVVEYRSIERGDVDDPV